MKNEEPLLPLQRLVSCPIPLKSPLPLWSISTDSMTATCGSHLDFFDAFNLNEDWFSNCYLAMDQGPIVPMIENYRTGLCWEMFMTNPEINVMLNAINTVEFANTDIGDVSACGSMETNNGEYTIQGSGWDMWEYWDECHFAYRRLSGDSQITARIENMDYTHEWAKAGVMIRESLSTDSKQARNILVNIFYGLS